MQNQRVDVPYRECTVQGFNEVCGSYSGRAHLDQGKEPYLMIDDVVVAEKAKLTIEPGTVVRVVDPSISGRYNGGLNLVVEGTLIARGTPDEMICFTAAAQHRQQYDEWLGITFAGETPSILTWTRVDYARIGVSCYGPCLIAHNVLRYCQTGISIQQGFSGDVANNVVAYSRNTGVECQGQSVEANIVNNIFYAVGRPMPAWQWPAIYADYNLCCVWTPATAMDAASLQSPRAFTTSAPIPSSLTPCASTSDWLQALPPGTRDAARPTWGFAPKPGRGQPLTWRSASGARMERARFGVRECSTSLTIATDLGEATSRIRSSAARAGGTGWKPKATTKKR